MKQSCKIVPRNGDTSGMDKLYEHVLKKQEEKHKAEIDSLRKEMDEKLQNMSKGDTASIEHKEMKATQIGAGRDAIVDLSTKNIKTINKITVNFFGSENTDHIKPTNVIDLVKKLGPLGADLGKASDRLILSMAMMIFSDPKHPENITCYVPNKKSKEVLIHDETGWSVSPISLTLSPMASRSVDELFRKQPSKKA